MYVARSWSDCVCRYDVEMRAYVWRRITVGGAEESGSEREMIMQIGCS